MVGQTCLECQSGTNGHTSCDTSNKDDWSLNSPQPCGKPLKSAPAHRHEYHQEISIVWGIQP